MIEYLLPRWFKDYLKVRLRRAVAPSISRERYFSYRPEARCYAISADADTQSQRHSDSPLPIPPPELLGGYSANPQRYLETGARDIEAIRVLTADHGLPLEEAGRILDFGCATGRMIRVLHDLAMEQEIWGTDIDANRIVWCQQNLSPPFHFATTTTDPHLPFEDRYFGFIFAGSVFTHMDDLADAWFLELRRVLRPGGRLYITICDRHSIQLLDGKYKDHAFGRWLRNYPEYATFSHSTFGKIVMERSLDSQVFYDLNYLTEHLEPFFKKVAVQEEAYAFQTGVLLERT